MRLGPGNADAVGRRFKVVAVLGAALLLGAGGGSSASAATTPSADQVSSCVAQPVLADAQNVLATPPAGVSKIAFERGGDIYVVKPDGTGVRDLTNSAPACGVNSSDPAWSPDGATIAFDRVPMATGSPTQLFLMNANGTDLRPLTIDGNDFEPSWSPDGTRLAFVHWSQIPTSTGINQVDGTLGLGIGNIEVINADGTGEHTIVSGLNEYPRWSPDGTKIIFSALAPASNADLFAVNPDGSDRQQLTNSACDTYPHYSPDGTQVLFQHGQNCFAGPQQVWLMNADGTNAHQLSTGTSAAGNGLSWSPDGSQIVFSNAPSQFSGEHLYTMNADGSAITQVTSDRRSDYAPDWAVAH